MLMARHQKIAKLFDEDFWVTQWRSQEKATGCKTTTSRKTTTGRASTGGTQGNRL